MNKAYLQMIICQFKDFLREPGALFWTFVFPILMIIGLGNAFNNDAGLVRNVSVITNDNDTIYNFIKSETKESDLFADSVRSFEYVSDDSVMGETRIRFLLVDDKTASTYLKKGIADLILSSENGQVKYNFDPASSDARLTQLLLSNIFRYGQPWMGTERIQPIVKKGSRYVDFLVPGMMTMGIMMSCMWGISYTLIEKRSKKLLKRMIASPMNKSEFLLAQMTTRLILALIEALTVFLFAYLIFDFTLQGSLPAILLLFLSGNIAFIGIAILVSSRTSSTHMGNGLINFITSPMMILSGIFFNYHSFPDWAVNIISKLPLTIFTDTARAIFNEGTDWMQVMNASVILTLLGTVCFVIGLKIFKWY